MEKIIRTIIIASASLIASILFLFGIRQITINKNKKHGLFMTTLLIALSLIGYDIATFAAQDTDQSVESTEKQKRQLDKVVELNNTQEWKHFKTFWKKLNQIVPKKENGRKEKIFFGEYAGAITGTEASNLQMELKKLISSLEKLEQEGKIDAIEIALLERICAERIKYMSFGFLSRIMPPPLWVDKQNAIKDLERKIDILIELRKKEKIDEQEFQQALLNIREDIKTFSILDTISSHYVIHYYSLHQLKREQADIKISIIERHISEFERHYADYQAKKPQGEIDDIDIPYKDLDIKYKATKQAIVEVKEVLPSFTELIIDLEK